MQYYRAYQRLGLKGLYEHLYMFRQIKEGTLVGQDRYGNKYFENLDLPYGQHRWLEPKNYEAQQLFDASSIPPEWHGWMHYTTDRVPSEKPLPSGPAMVKQTDVPKPLDTHQVPETVRSGEWRPNPTLNRERGYGVKNMYQTQMGGNGYYIQPGSVASPLHKEHVPKVFENAWTPPSGMMKKNPNPPSKFQKFAAEREALNKAEEKQGKKH
jgi:NADH:ubiquinone oxidoreductase subunit